MGLLSKLKHSEEDQAPTTVNSNTETSTTSQSTEDLSSSIMPSKFCPSSDTSSKSTSTPSKAHQPERRSAPKNWPAIPHAADYKERLAQMEEDSKTQPHKKSWLQKKLDLADPSEPEYYERRYTASGEGGEYEQVSRIARLGGGGGGFLL
jgi:hypothetical protein